ncbi:flagellar biosynthetic protein FliO [Ruminococcus sp. HUN007]|uniref:flagellar biosynthetic protein FliO n=1 Tax=Ruminococcus sp. HUN007 TaxID=1514668 RepID=UPI0005D18B13|nr:flagellar biosynthetic protein FliO [Ruminococcus sp. HUN007]
MNGSAAGRVITVLFTIVLFAAILYLAYLTTKYIGKKYSISSGMSGKNLKIIDSLSLAPDKVLMIVKAGGKTVLVGLSREHMEYICDVDENELTIPENGAVSPFQQDLFGAFRNVLSEKMKNLKQKENENDKKE